MTAKKEKVLRESDDIGLGPTCKQSHSLDMMVGLSRSKYSDRILVHS